MDTRVAYRRVGKEKKVWRASGSIKRPNSNDTAKGGVLFSCIGTGRVPCLNIPAAI